MAAERGLDGTVAEPRRVGIASNDRACGSRGVSAVAAHVAA